MRDYVLNPEHALGRHKARLFAAALGIGRDDWPYPEQIGLTPDRDGNVSFRRVLQTLAPIIRADGVLPTTALAPRPAAQSEDAQDEDDTLLIPNSALAWLAGVALLVLVGALVIVACVSEERPRYDGPSPYWRKSMPMFWEWWSMLSI